MTLALTVEEWEVINGWPKWALYPECRGKPYNFNGSWMYHKPIEDDTPGPKRKAYTKEQILEKARLRMRLRREKYKREKAAKLNRSQAPSKFGNKPLVCPSGK